MKNNLFSKKYFNQKKYFLLNSVIAFCFLIFLVAMSSCGKKDVVQEEKQSEKFCVSDTLQKMIQIGMVSKENVEDLLQVGGEVTFNQDKVVRVMPLISGQVSDVKTNLGDYVQKGQILATLKSSEIVGNSNDQRSATADIAIYKKNMESMDASFKNGMASEKDYLNSKQDYEKSLSAYARASGFGKIYGSSNADGLINVIAPISGFIVEKKIANGSFVRSDNADNLFTIGNVDDVWVMANIFETDISRVKVGYEAEITTIAYPDKVFHGKIDKVGNMLDPLNKALKVRIKLNNDNKLLKPQMFTNVTIKNTQGIQSLVVPSSAITFDYGKNYVIVYRDKCDLDVREVNILKTLGDKTYLTSGVTEGEKIVTRNQLLIYNAFKK